MLDNPAGASPGYIADRLKNDLATEVSEAFARLLQTKHLYQSEAVRSDFIEAAVRSIDTESAAAVRGAVHPLRDGRWIPETPQEQRAPPIGDIDARFKFLWFRLGTVKLFCIKCERVEPYNPLFVQDTTERSGYFTTSPKAVQVFTCAFLCQSCKSIPEVFLIRRLNLKLMLCGRAPMEHVPTAAFLPRNQQRHFADAILAYNSGQFLPGLFMLRTTIEQFVREQYGKPVETPEALTAAFDAYMASLPAAFRSTFPSLPDLYMKLSAALHSADASPELFLSSRAAVEQHFDARRLFGLVNGAA